MALFKTSLVLNEMVQLTVPAGDSDPNYVCVDIQLDGSQILEIYGVNWGFTAFVPATANVNLFSSVYICEDAAFNNTIFTPLVPSVPFPSPELFNKLVFSSTASFSAFSVVGAELLLPSVMKYEDFSVPFPFFPAHRVTIFAAAPIVNASVPQFDYTINLMARGAIVPVSSYGYAGGGMTTR